MKKFCLGTAFVLLFSTVSAQDTSFTGVFIGVSVGGSSESETINSVVKDENGNAVYADDSGKRNEATASKNAMCRGIVLGYGYQFQNHLYVSVFYESSLSSRASMTYEYVTPYEDIQYMYGTGGIAGNPTIAGHVYTGGDLKSSKKLYAPSFGMSFGRVVSHFCFGLRCGMSFEKGRIEREVMRHTRIYLPADNIQVNESVETTVVGKTQSFVFPFIGAYVEYKFGHVVAFLNVDYKLKQDKSVNFSFADGNGERVITRHVNDIDENAERPWNNDNVKANAISTDTQHITRKRHAWKISIGIKFVVSSLREIGI